MTRPFPRPPTRSSPPSDDFYNERRAQDTSPADPIEELRRRSSSGSELLVSGHLFSMATIFEDFVTVALREAMKPYGGRSALQHRTHLDEAETVPIRPDFVWLERGVPRIVVDAKYKAEKPSGFPQADLYQLLAYCTVLGLPVGHLVYAKGFEDAREHVVRNAGVRIVAHTLDLELEPAGLLASVASLAERMVEPVDTHSDMVGIRARHDR